MKNLNCDKQLVLFPGHNLLLCILLIGLGKLIKYKILIICTLFVWSFRNFVLTVCQFFANMCTCLHFQTISLQKLQRKKRRKIKASEDLILALISLFLVEVHFHLVVYNFSSFTQEKERTAWADWSSVHSCYWPFSFWRVSWGWDSAI